MKARKVLGNVQTPQGTILNNCMRIEESDSFMGGFLGSFYRKGSVGDRNGSARNSPRHTAQSQVPHHLCHPDQDDADDDGHCHSDEIGGVGIMMEMIKEMMRKSLN